MAKKKIMEDIGMRNDFIAHSAKGTSWKDHKYIRKEGDRYIYKEPSHNIANEVVESPHIQEDAEKLDKIEPVRKVRDILNTPIWSSNPDEKGLINKGTDEIAKMFNKEDKKKQLAKR